MTHSGPEAEASPPSSFLKAVKAYFGTWIDLLSTRLELLSLDVEEQQERFQQLIILGAASVLCLSFGMMLVTAFVIALFWDTNYRLAVLGGFAFIYLAAGVVVGVITLRKSRGKPKLFGASLDELAKDYRRLSS